LFGGGSKSRKRWGGITACFGPEEESGPVSLSRSVISSTNWEVIRKRFYGTTEISNS
jgi:hypothetical protein